MFKTRQIYNTICICLIIPHEITLQHTLVVKQADIILISKQGSDFDANTENGITFDHFTVKSSSFDTRVVNVYNASPYNGAYKRLQRVPPGV